MSQRQFVSASSIFPLVSSQTIASTLRSFVMLFVLGGLAGQGFAQAPSNESDVLQLAVQVASVTPRAVRLTYDEHVRLQLTAKAFAAGRLQQANGVWGSLIRDAVTQGGALPNFDLMMYTVARRAFLEEDVKLLEPANRLRFAAEKLRVIREELVLIDDRLKESVDQSEIDALTFERKEREIAEALAEQSLEEAKATFEANALIASDALRLIRDAFERMQQTVRKYTQT